MEAQQPPALLITAGDDEWDTRFKQPWCSLRLLSVVYARRLSAAGVAATHRHYAGPGKQKRPHCFMCNDYVGRSLWCVCVSLTA
jgi:acetyl esterase/lipase